MPKKDQIRENLYETFAKNLAAIKEEDFVHLEPNIENCYICPLCARCFTKNDLDQGKPNCLTIEDIPPKALGGRPLALTCKQCNNKSGTLLDEQLRRKLAVEEFALKIPEAYVEASIKFKPKLYTSGTLSHRVDGGLNICLFKNGFQTKKGKGKCYPKLAEDLRANGIKDFNFSIKTYKKNYPNIALLRIAYLLAFSKFGNGFLFNPNLNSIRKQIQNPTQNILPNFGVLEIENPFDPGIYVIVSPIELRSILVTFCLKTKNRTTKHAVILPGPDECCMEVYINMANHQKINGGLKFNAELIPSLDYLNDPRLKFAPQIFWDTLN